MALRFNPAVKNEEISLLTEKLKLDNTLSALRPQLNDRINLGLTQSNNGTTLSQMGTDLQMDTRYGGHYALTLNSSTLAQGSKPTLRLQAEQKLLRGAGHAANIPYLQSQESYEIAKQSYRQALINQVSRTANAFWQQTLRQREAKNTASLSAQVNRSVANAKKEFAAGRISRSELTQNQLSLATNAFLANESKQNSDIGLQEFIVSLGLPADAHIRLKASTVSAEPPLPGLHQSIERALAHNIPYQIERELLLILKQSMDLAKNNQQIGLDVNASIGSNAQSHTPWVDKNSAQVGLSLSIPLNQRAEHYNFVSAQAAYRQAKNNIKQSKNELIARVKMDYQVIKSTYTRIKLAQRALKLAKQTLANNELKLTWGRVTQQDVNISRNNWLGAQNNTVATRIAYLQSLSSTMCRVRSILKAF